MGAAAGFKRLSQDQVDAINRVEGGYHGKKKLASIIDDALDVAVSELPTGIPQANVTNLVSNLAAKLTASQGAAVANIGVTSNLVGVDGTGSNAAPLVGTEARLDAIEAKVDALLGSLRTAGIIAP